jgi:hypothetical protein
MDAFGAKENMAKKQNDSSNHHFLPQSILRNFAIDEKNRLYVYDKLLGKPFTNTTENIGSENNYNTIEYQGTVINLEESFQKYDDQLALVSKKIITNGDLKCLTPEEYDFLYVILLVQIHRSPITRTTLQTINKQLNTLMTSTMGIKPEEDIDDNYAKILSLAAIFNNTEPLLEIIRPRYFILLQTNNDDTYFITSDNAVLLIGHSEYEPVSLKSSFTEICFPLSPKYSLSLLPQVICNDINNDKISSVKELKNAVINKQPLVIDKENAIYLNFAQVNQSKRFLYSKYDLQQYLSNELKYIPDKKEKKSLYNVGNEFLRANVRKNAHIVLYINSYFYDYDIHEYLNSKVNLEVLISLKTNVLDKYAHVKIPQIFFYDNQYPVRMIRNVKIARIDYKDSLYYYQVIPEFNIKL